MSNGTRRSVQQMFADAADSINRNAASAYDYFNRNRAVFPRRGRPMPRPSGIGTIPFDVGSEADNARRGGMSDYQIQAMLARAKRPGLPIPPSVMASVQRPTAYDPTSDLDNMARYGTAQFLNNPPPVYSMSTEGRPTPLVAEREKDVSTTAEQVAEKTGFMPRAEAATIQNMASERRAGPPMSRVPATNRVPPAELGVAEQGMTRMPQPAPPILPMEDARDIGDGGGRLPRRGPPMAEVQASKMLPKRRLTPSRDAVMPGDMSGASAEELDAAAQKGSELDIDAPKVETPKEEPQATDAEGSNIGLIRLGLQIAKEASKPGASFIGAIAGGAANALEAKDKRDLIAAERKFKRDTIKDTQDFKALQAKLERQFRSNKSDKELALTEESLRLKSTQIANDLKNQNDTLNLAKEKLAKTDALERSKLEARSALNLAQMNYYNARAAGESNKLQGYAVQTHVAALKYVATMLPPADRRSMKPKEMAARRKQAMELYKEANGLSGLDLIPDVAKDLDDALDPTKTTNIFEDMKK